MNEEHVLSLAGVFVSCVLFSLRGPKSHTKKEVEPLRLLQPSFREVSGEDWTAF
jgi:hypothetical protein